jgi:hypothetical protein
MTTAGFVVIALLVASAGLAARVQAPVVASEADVEAAYLFRFISYVDWPAAPAAAPFQICIADSRRVASALSSIAGGERSASRPILVRALDAKAPVDGCQMVFVGGETTDARLDEILDQVRSQPVLTVGEGDRFAAGTGMITFSVRDRRVKFAVNLKAAEAAGLKVSSELLRHAVAVTR